MIKLNAINEKQESKENIFTPFTKIIFDPSKLEYYLEFKLYTSDLYEYLKKICKAFKQDKNKLIKLFNDINEMLNHKLQTLLDINYLCFDIKLANILISYDETTFEIKEIVLHDFDMEACCDISKSNSNCKKEEDTTKFMLIYYKLVLFYWSNKIIMSIQELVYIPEITALFHDDLDLVNLQDFFEFFINANAYTLNDDDFSSIKEKMHFYFNHYVLQYIEPLNPGIYKIVEHENGVLKVYDNMVLAELFKDALKNKKKF